MQLDASLDDRPRSHYTYTYEPSINKTRLTIEINDDAKLSTDVSSLITQLAGDTEWLVCDQQPLLESLLQLNPSISMDRSSIIRPSLNYNHTIFRIVKKQSSHKSHRNTNITSSIDRFKGKRLTELKERISMLNNENDGSGVCCCAITGISGCGKSELAKRYLLTSCSENVFCWRFEPDQRLGTSQISYKDAFKALFRNFDIDYESRGGETEDVAWVRAINMFWEKVKTYSKSILCFDNATTYMEIEIYLPKNGEVNCEIIVTTQNMKFFTPMKHNFLIKGLDPVEASELLEELSELKDSTSSILAEKLDYSPLSIRITGYYIHNQNTTLPVNSKLSFVDYIALLEENEPLLEDLDPGFISQVTGGSFKNSLRASLKLSIKKVRPEFLRLIQYCAFMANERIPRDLLFQLYNDDRVGNIKSPQAIKIAFNDLVTNQYTYSLLSLDETSEMFYIHRSTQLEVMMTIGPNLRGTMSKLFGAINTSYPWDRYSVTTVKMSQSISHHISVLLHHMRKDGENISNCIFLLIRLAQIAEEYSEYSTELACAEEALNLLKHFSYHDEYLLAKVYSTMSLAKHRLYRFEQSLQDADHALQHYTLSSNSEEVDIAEVYDTKGWNYRNLNWEESFSNHTTALNIYLKYQASSRECRLRTAVSYNGIAMYYEAKGMFADALENYNKALDVRVKMLGEDHPYTAIIYANVGVLSLHDRSKLQDIPIDADLALDYMQKALKIRRDTYGDKSLFVVVIYKNLGLFFYRAGDFEKALLHLDRALEIGLEILGTDHLIISDLYAYKAMILSRSGAEAEATTQYERALAICRRYPESASKNLRINRINSAIQGMEIPLR